MPSAAEFRTLSLGEALAFTASTITKLAMKDELSLVLTGGRSGLALAEAAGAALAEYPGRSDIWFSDERFVPLVSPERTDVNLIAALGSFGEKANIHRVIAPEQGSLAQAAVEYQNQLQAASRPFDLVILSMGEDGHVASLFPGHDSLTSENLAIAESNSPKPPSERVSISLAKLADACEIHIYAMGEGKRAALVNFDNTPAGLLAWKFREVSPNGRLFVMSDLVL